MKTICKKYTPADYDGIIGFFRELHKTSNHTQYWLPQRFEYAEFFIALLHKNRGVKIDWKETIFLWEDEKGKVVALLCSESPDENIFIFTLPKYRQLEEEMIHKAEKVIKEIVKQNTIKLWSDDSDTFRNLTLVNLGYTKNEEVEYLNWIDLKEAIPEFRLPEGHTVHNMVDETGLDLQHKIDKITAAFDSPTYPVEIYRNLQKGPSYRKDFDLYTTDSKGDVVSFCIIWIEPELNVGYIEPVGTDAQHRKKGLARATINVGLHRLKQAGINKAFVGSYGNDRMNFYDVSGFTNRITLHTWSRQ